MVLSQSMLALRQLCFQVIDRARFRFHRTNLPVPLEIRRGFRSKSSKLHAVPAQAAGVGRDARWQDDVDRRQIDTRIRLMSRIAVRVKIVVA